MRTSAPIRLFVPFRSSIFVTRLHVPTAKNIGDAYRKLEWSQHHINDLNGKITDFLAQKPFKLIIRHQPKASKMTFRVKTEKSIPPEFSLIIGDAVHNLRAALDLLLYALAVERAPSPDNIQFPFPRNSTDNALTGTINSGQVKLAGKKVEEAIRKLDPRPTGNPILSGVHALDVRDKHKLLILSRYLPELSGDELGRLVAPYYSLVKFVGPGVFRITTTEDLITLDRRYTTRWKPNSEEETEIQPVFNISFSKGQIFENQVVIEVLVKAAKAIRQALDEIVIAYLDPENEFPA